MGFGNRIALFAIVAPLALGMAIGMSSVAFVQASTPSPDGAGDMGVCSAALHIGATGDAYIKVVHAPPDAPAVDVFLDGSTTLSDLAFGSFSGWIAVPAGKHHIQVTATGSDPSTAVIDADAELTADAAYEVVALGLQADIKPAIFVATPTSLFRSRSSSQGALD